jgi:hypothetical protein
MALTSVINEAEDALLSLIAGSAVLTGVDRRLGEPFVLKSEHIWIDDRIEEEQEWDTTGTGGQARTETFVLAVKVYVQKPLQPGVDVFGALRDRLSVLAEEVELLVRNNANLGVAASVFDSEVAGIDRDGGPRDQTRWLGITLRVRVTALLA